MHNRNGFTLIELLMVLSIMALMGTVSMTFTTAMKKNRQAQKTETTDGPFEPDRQARRTQQAEKPSRIEQLGIDRQCGSIEQTTTLSNVSVKSRFDGPFDDDPMSYINTDEYSLKVRADVQGETDLTLVQTTDCDHKLVHAGTVSDVASLNRK